MSRQMDWILEKISFCFMAACVVLIPLATGIARANHYQQVFIIFSAFFSVAVLFYLILRQKLIFYLKRGKIYLLLTLYLFLLSTIKYLISLINHQGITFFTVYQFVVYSVFGYFAYVFISDGIKHRLPLFLCILSVYITFIIVVSKNRFMLDQSVFRFLGPYSNPNILVIFSVLSCFCTLYLIEIKYGYFVIHIGMFSVGAASTILSGSRTGLLALLVGCFVYFLCFYFAARSAAGIERKKWKAALKYVFFTIIMILAFTWLFVPRSEQKESAVVVGTGISSSNNPSSAEDNDASDNSKEAFLERYSFQTEGSSSLTNNLRYSIWKEYLKIAGNYFLYGTDYTISDRPIINNSVRDTHNTFLYTFYRFGILGLLLLIALTVSIFLKFIFKRKRNSGETAIFSLFCSFGIISLATDLLNTPVYFFVLAVTYTVLQDSVTGKEYKPDGSNGIPRISQRTAQNFASLFHLEQRRGGISYDGYLP